MKPQFFAPHIAGAAHLTGAHRLGHRAFNACSFGIQHPRIPQCPVACARSAERCNSVHLDAESALSPQFWYSEHEANTLGKPGEETGPEVLAGRAGQGYVPNLDWFARQGSGPVWPANQCESRCDQTGLLSVEAHEVSGITGPTIST